MFSQTKHVNCGSWNPVEVLKRETVVNLSAMVTKSDKRSDRPERPQSHGEKTD